MGVSTTSTFFFVLGDDFYSSKHTSCVFMFYGDLDTMTFILYKLYILSPYTNPTPKPTHHRELFALLHFQKNIT